MTNTLYMLFGAALVALGVLAAALADRIRGLRISRDARETVPRERANRAAAGHAYGGHPSPAYSARSSIPVVSRATQSPAKPAARPEGGEDVIAALVAAGYKKPIATEAAWACSAAERTTVESWTASALRRCANGGRA